MAGSDRRPTDDRYLEWKVRLFAVAAVLGLVGIYGEEQWMTASAIALLAAAMLLRFLPGGGGGGMYGEDDDGDDEAAEAETVSP